MQADVSKNEDVEWYVKATIDEYGRIDAFFNNAGVLQQFNLLENIELSEFERVINVNVRGVFLGLKHVLKVMGKQGYGSVINTASTAGIRSEHSMVGLFRKQACCDWLDEICSDRIRKKRRSGQRYLPWRCRYGADADSPSHDARQWLYAGGIPFHEDGTILRPGRSCRDGRVSSLRQVQLYDRLGRRG